MGLLDGLRGYWDCDEAGGSDRVSKVNGIDFVETGTVTSVTGALGDAVDGTGNASNILDQASTPLLLFGDEPMTVSCWANVNVGENLSNGPILAVWDATGNQRSWLLWFRAGGVERWQFLASSDGSASSSINSALAPPFDGTFQHVVIQHDPVGNVITLRVDDGAVQSQAHTTGLFATSTARPGLGVINQGGTAIVHIQHADEIGVWDRLLSDDEITELNNGGTPLPFTSFTTDVVDQVPLAESAAYDERSGNFFTTQPIAAGEEIFDGALVAFESATGRVINWQDPTSSTDLFLGLARITDETGIAAAGGEARIGNSAGSRLVDIFGSGSILRSIAVLGAVAASLGDQVYSADENTFSMTPTPGGNAIGHVVRVHASGIADVKIFSTDDWRGGRKI